MRFTVTALGSAGDKPVGVVVGQVARYLLAPDQQPAPTADGPAGSHQMGEECVSRYYAHRGNTPGHWLGVGARELGLEGTVDFDAFTTVLAGRDPRTGARLISARGSAGRVASVGAGTAARWNPEGEALYAVRDVATVLGWSQADVRDAIAAGEQVAVSQALATLAGAPVPVGTTRTHPSPHGPGRASGTPGPEPSDCGDGDPRPPGRGSRTGQTETVSGWRCSRSSTGMGLAM